MHTDIHTRKTYLNILKNDTKCNSHRKCTDAQSLSPKHITAFFFFLKYLTCFFSNTELFVSFVVRVYFRRHVPEPGERHRIGQTTDTSNKLVKQVVQRYSIFDRFRDLQFRCYSTTQHDHDLTGKNSWYDLKKNVILYETDFRNWIFFFFYLV